MDSGEFTALDARLRSLEAQAHALRSDLDALAPRPAPPHPAPPQPGPAATPSPRAKSSLETLVAGRGLQLAGLLLVLLGTAFFLDLAFTRGWIGPAERILLGLVAGAASIAFGARMLTGAYRFLAEGLIGLGAGIVYLALWASIAVFPELGVSRIAAFAAMIAVTAVLAALAATHRSERIAVLGIVGGFLTPVLLSGGPTDRVVLAAYLLLLSGGMLALALRCAFRSVEALTFVAAICYAGTFAPQPTGWSSTAAYAVATLFFLEFAAAFTFAAVTGNGSATRAALLAIDVALYAGALEIIFADRQTALGVALLALAAALLGTTRLRALPRAIGLTYGYLGLATVTLALPGLLHASSLLDAFSLEAALLAVLGARSGDRRIALAGASLFALTGLTLIVMAGTNLPEATLATPLTLAFAIWLAGITATRTQLAAATRLDEGERHGWTIGAGIAFNVVALAGLSRIVLDLLGGRHWSSSVPSDAQYALSLLWTLYATALFAIGLRTGSAVRRWQGLVLFAITIGKVFLVDLASLDAEYRVASFVGLGVVLVGLSAWYTRATRTSATEAEA